MTDEQNDLFSSIFSTTYSEKLIEEIQLKSQNSIVALLNSIVLSLTFYCKMSYNYILKYMNSDHLFLDCYIKRVSIAITLV
jgi:hypothetical protein